MPKNTRVHIFLHPTHNKTATALVIVVINMTHMNRPLMTLTATAALTLAVLTPAAAQNTDYSESQNYKKAMEAAAAGDLNGALREINAEIQVHPRNAAAYNTKAEWLRFKPDATNADIMHCLTTALAVMAEDDDDFNLTFMNYVSLLVNSGDTAQALSLLDYQMEKKPWSYTLFRKADILCSQSKFAEALDAFRKARELDKKDNCLADDMISVGIISCLADMEGRDVEADKEIAYARTNHISSTIWRYPAILYLTRKGRKDEAVDLITDLVTLGSRDQHMVNLAKGVMPEFIKKAEDVQTSASAGDDQKRNMLTLAMHAADGTNPAECLRLVRTYGLSDDMKGWFDNNYIGAFANEKALKIYSDKLDMQMRNGDYADANDSRITVATLQARIGDVTSAENTLRDAIDYTPANSSAYTRYARILTDYTDRYAEAAAYADTALALELGFEQAALKMLNLFRLGDKQGAQAMADKIISTINLNTATGVMCRVRRLALAVKGEKKAAIKALEEGLQIYGYQKYVDQAQVYGVLGMTDEAIENLRAAFAEGYRDFLMIEKSPELATVRGKRAYKKLVSEYKAKYAKELMSYND